MGDDPKTFHFCAFQTPDRLLLRLGRHVLSPFLFPPVAPLRSDDVALPLPEPDQVTLLPAPDQELSPDPTAPPEKQFNYHSYFSEIEAAFAARRRRAYHLSPADWALVECWRKEGIPLPVVLRGIEQTFAARAAARQPKGRLRPIRSLSYCQPAVEEAFQAYRAAQAGAHPATPPTPEANSPSPATVIAFLESAVASLFTVRQNLVEQAQTDAPRHQLLDALSVALAQLQAMIEQVRSEAVLRLDTLELALSDLEDRLLAALHADAPPAVLSEAIQAAATALKPHRKGMSAAVYAQAQANYVARLLRQYHGIPRLSLLYLEPES
ncbi:hypothetical protein J8C06_10005 [Chloracidobacterium validum]|uniref:Uncharacterized protein n=1 Tax=Chloracidobacterium validum TaxID=2821543 RepID=A0ABX8BAC4_9BACT|nr:hypothetical protein [Chloracidobacterium validum]QUW02665.1 hypothetical protein J8C06_10005 [Chloracidobacterium validum]